MAMMLGEMTPEHATRPLSPFMVAEHESMHELDVKQPYNTDQSLKHNHAPSQHALLDDGEVMFGKWEPLEPWRRTLIYFA